MRVTIPATLSLAAALLLAGTTPAAAQGAARFTLTSTDLRPGGTIPARHVANAMGCTGQNVSPALRWSGAPAATKSFAVTAYDPDAPTGSGWWHWVVYNIPASTTTLPAGAGDAKGTGLPSGAAQGNTDVGQPGYFGPCPPPGDKPHRYIFTVYALKTEKIDVPANATAAMVGFNLHANQLAKATLTARYGR
jgi:Raf kinase inhibitor-like YbhB/YbcL family protein